MEKNYSRGGGDSGDGGDGGPETPGSGLLTPQQEMDEITRRLDKLCEKKMSFLHTILLLKIQ